MQKLNEKGLYDIYTLWHVPFWQTQTFYLATIIGITIVLLSLSWWIIRQYLKKSIQPKTPWQQALEQLHILQQKTYHSKEEGKYCYFAMTAIIKTYLTAQFGYSLHGKTDEEVINYLAKTTNQKTIADELKEIMDGCLYIKFANEKAMQETIMKHLEQCRSMITKTIPEQNNTHYKTQTTN